MPRAPHAEGSRHVRGVLGWVRVEGRAAAGAAEPVALALEVAEEALGLGDGLDDRGADHDGTGRGVLAAACEEAGIELLPYGDLKKALLALSSAGVTLTLREQLHLMTQVAQAAGMVALQVSAGVSFQVVPIQVSRISRAAFASMSSGRMRRARAPERRSSRNSA